MMKVGVDRKVNASRNYNLILEIAGVKKKKRRSHYQSFLHALSYASEGTGCYFVPHERLVCG
jgi:hypothetical protein